MNWFLDRPTCTRLLLGVFFVILTSSSSAFAQTATATLSGSVVDDKDAVVPGVEITISNPETGFKRTAITNDLGFYSFPALPPGTYVVTTRRDGFSRSEIKDVVLNVSDVRGLRIQLTVGQVGETVNISSTADTVKQDLAVSTIVDRQFVSNLPLNGRSIQTLITLDARRSDHWSQFAESGPIQCQRTADKHELLYSGRCQRKLRNNNFAGYNPAVAGAVPAASMQGSFSNLVSVDALQEFKIQTSTFSPEFGRSPGAQVSLVTRSGENLYHGSAYNYFRNDALDANDYFNNLNNIKKQPLRYNNFGGTFSGPVRFPKKVFGPLGYDGRDHTFFFFSYEGQRFLLPQGAVVTVVPSVTARRNAPNEIASQILNAFPVPNGPDIINPITGPTGGANFTSAYSEPSASNATSIRVDHNFGQRYSAFVRYNYAPSRQQSREMRDLAQFNRLRQ